MLSDSTGLKGWVKTAFASAGGLVLGALVIGTFQAAQEFHTMRQSMDTVTQTIEENTRTTSELSRRLTGNSKRLDALNKRLDDFNRRLDRVEDKQ